MPETDLDMGTTADREEKKGWNLAFHPRVGLGEIDITGRKFRSYLIR
jgi:hypothetical protein